MANKQQMWEGELLQSSMQKYTKAETRPGVTTKKQGCHEIQQEVPYKWECKESGSNFLLSKYQILKF